MQQLIEYIWQLRLYVTEKIVKFVTALSNLYQYCEVYLQEKYQIKVIGLLKYLQLMHNIIGDLSNEKKVSVGLNIRLLNAVL